MSRGPVGRRRVRPVVLFVVGVMMIDGATALWAALDSAGFSATLLPYAPNPVGHLLHDYAAATLTILVVGLYSWNRRARLGQSPAHAAAKVVGIWHLLHGLSHVYAAAVAPSNHVAAWSQAVLLLATGALLVGVAWQREPGAHRYDSVEGAAEKHG